MEIGWLINCYRNEALKKNYYPPESREGLIPFQPMQLPTIPQRLNTDKKLAPGQRAESSS